MPFLIPIAAVVAGGIGSGAVAIGGALVGIGGALGVGGAGLAAGIVGGLAVGSVATSIGTGIASAVATPPSPPKLMSVPDRTSAQRAGIDAARRARARGGRESTTLLTGASELLSTGPNEDVLGG